MQEESEEERQELEAMAMVSSALTGLPFKKLPGGTRLYDLDPSEFRVAGDRLTTIKASRVTKPPEDGSA